MPRLRALAASQSAGALLVAGLALAALGWAYWRGRGCSRPLQKPAGSGP